MMKYLLACVFLLLSCHSSMVTASPSECRNDSLRLAMIPKKNIDDQIREFQPLIQLLSDGLNRPVQIVRATSYQSVVDALVSGGVDIAVLGPASYLLAYQRDSRVEPFVSLTIEAGHFSPAGSSYHSILLVRVDSGIQALNELRGGKVALNDPASTSGALIPNTEFPDTVGEPLERFFSAQVYAGSHDRALDALLEGRVNAAFVASTRADEYLNTGRMDRDTLRVLWRSEPIHYDPFVFSAGVCADVRQRVRELMTTSSPQMSAFLKSQGTTGVNPVSHTHYQPLLRLMAR